MILFFCVVCVFPSCIVEIARGLLLACAHKHQIKIHTHLNSPPSTTHSAGLPSLPPPQLQALLKAEVDAACAGRSRWEHVAAIEVLPQPLSPEDGTLTRTMKPRREAIMAKYGAEVDRLQARLR